MLTLEANDEASVVWSKPDDVQIDPMHPLRHLVGLRQQAFLAGMADGSVRKVNASTQPDQVQALITRDGNEIIEAHGSN